MLFKYLKNKLGINNETKIIKYNIESNPTMSHLMTGLLKHLYYKEKVESSVLIIDDKHNITFSLKKIDFFPSSEKYSLIKIYNSRDSFSITIRIFNVSFKLSYNKKPKFLRHHFNFNYTVVEKHDHGRLIVTKINDLHENINTEMEFNSIDKYIFHDKTEFYTLYINDNKNTYGYLYSDTIDNIEIYFIYDKKTETISSTNIDFNKIKKQVRVK